jgi:hypothetical protein
MLRCGKGAAWCVPERRAHWSCNRDGLEAGHDGRCLGIYVMPSNERNSDYCQAVIKISLVTTAPMASGRPVSLLPHKTVKANMVTTTTSGRSWGRSSSAARLPVCGQGERWRVSDFAYVPQAEASIASGLQGRLAQDQDHATTPEQPKVICSTR